MSPAPGRRQASKPSPPPRSQPAPIGSAGPSPSPADLLAVRLVVAPVDDDAVVAGAAVDRVVPGARDQDGVVATAALDVIASRPTVEDVFAGATRDAVRAAAAADPVV